jgi:TRAP-type C4-dicarboxylate transport system permease small subunit
MQKLLKAIDRGLFAAIAVLLMAMVANVAWQVFSRHVLDDPPAWTEEIARYVFTWQIFLGAALAFGRGTHIVVDIVLALSGPGLRRVLGVLSYLACLALLFPLVKFGIAMVGLTSNTYAAASGLNIGVVYAALPVGAAIGAVYVILNLAILLRGGTVRQDEASTMVD